MSGLRSLPFDDIMRRGSIGHADIRTLRRVFYEDGIVSSDEAELLLKLNDACRVQHPDWADFFVEALTDYLVYQESPAGRSDLNQCALADGPALA